MEDSNKTSPSLIKDKKNSSLIKLADDFKAIAKDLVEYVKLKTGKDVVSAGGIMPTAEKIKDIEEDEESKKPSREKKEGFIARLIDFLIKLPLYAAAWTIGKILQIPKFLEETMEKIGEGIGNFFKDLKEGLAALPDKFMESIKNLGDKLSEFWSDLTSGSWVEDLTSKISETYTKVKENIGRMYDNSIQWLTENFTAFKEWISKHFGKKEEVKIDVKTKPVPEKEDVKTKPVPEKEKEPEVIKKEDTLPTETKGVDAEGFEYTEKKAAKKVVKTPEQIEYEKKRDAELEERSKKSREKLRKSKERKEQQEAEKAKAGEPTPMAEVPTQELPTTKPEPVTPAPEKKQPVEVPTEKIPPKKPSVITTKKPEEATSPTAFTLNDAIYSAASETGVSAETLRIFAQLESSFGKFVESKTSSAKGPFQFINSTWSEMIKKHGKKYGIKHDEMTNEEMLNLRFDNRISALMASEFIIQNAKTLKIDPADPANADKLYLAHFLGPGGARDVLSGKGLTEKQKASIIKYNPNLKTASNEELMNFASGKTAKAGELLAKQSNENAVNKRVASKGNAPNVVNAPVTNNTTTVNNQVVVNSKDKNKTDVSLRAV